MKPTIHGLLGRIRPVMVVASCIGVVMAYLIGTFVTGPFHQASSSMGAMLACTSAVVVLQTPGLRESLRAGLLRVAGTALGALLAYAYLRLFAFSTLGMMLAVALLVVLSMLLGIPDNGRMATITLLAILLVSQRSHALPPGVNCLLRFVESALGVAVGVVLAWLTSHLSPAAHPAANSCPAPAPTFAPAPAPTFAPAPASTAAPATTPTSAPSVLTSTAPSPVSVASAPAPTVAPAPSSIPTSTSAAAPAPAPGAIFSASGTAASAPTSGSSVDSAPSSVDSAPSSVASVPGASAPAPGAIFSAPGTAASAPVPGSSAPSAAAPAAPAAAGGEQKRTGSPSREAGS